MAPKASRSALGVASGAPDARKLAARKTGIQVHMAYSSHMCPR